MICDGASKLAQILLRSLLCEAPMTLKMFIGLWMKKEFTFLS
jgi:hypothetical protein